MRKRRPDYRLIHAPEFELGMREDAPPALPPTGEPGAVFEYRPVRKPQSIAALSVVMKDLYASDDHTRRTFYKAKENHEWHPKPSR